MADEGVYCKNANIQALAGANANTTAKATAATDVYVLDVENMINVMTRYTWAVDAAAYAALPGATKSILMETAACYCAIKVINYDMSGFSSLLEATTMLDVLWATFDKNIKTLEDVKNRDFLIKGTSG